MEESTLSSAAPNDRPTEHESIIVVSGCVVEVETRHVGTSARVAAGRVSEPLPCRPCLDSPLEITATGHTEAQAVRALRRRIEAISRNRVG